MNEGITDELASELKEAINQVEHMHGLFHKTSSGRMLVEHWKKLLAKYATLKAQHESKK